MKPQIFANTVLILALAGFVSTASAANRFVRAGATGNGSGSDWSNAYTDLPGTLTRGDTYYIADGSYGSWTLDDNASGTTYIYIKKATAADHGTDTGWSSSYGVGQAVLKPIRFSKPPGGNGGYYDINGYSATATKNCGIKISNGTVNTTLIEYGISDTGNHPYCNYRYLELAGPYGTGDFNAGGQPWSYGMYLHGNNGAFDSSHTLVSHCYIHGVTTCFQDSGGNNYMTVEYTDMCDSREIGGVDHGNIYWVGSSYGTFRYNRIYNYNMEGMYFGGSTVNWAIYGNVFYAGTYYARGVEFRVTQTGTKIYNNTFVNLPLSAVRVMADAGSVSGVEIKNNILVSAGISLENGGTGVTTANNLSTTTAAFVNAAAGDFRLKAPSAGGALSAPYDKDPDGNARGKDGVWDVGAYEYGPGGSVNTNPAISVSTSSLDFGVMSVGSATNLTFTVRNAGGGMLSGTASVSLPFSIVSGASYNLASNQSQTVTVRYQPTAAGNHNQDVAFSSGVASLTVSGSAYTVLPGLSFAAGAGVISSPFVNSSGIVSQSSDTGVTDGGRAVYAFTTTNAGTYTIQAVVEAAGEAGNSLFVNIDAEPTDPQMIWHIPVATGFQTQTASWQGNGAYNAPEFAPKVFTLGAGTHQLIIRGREPNVRLQSVSIVSQSSGTTAPTPASNLRFLSAQ